MSELRESLGLTQNKKDRTNKPHLYFIECEVTGLVKIGSSNNVRRRLAELNTSSPTKMRISAVIRNMGELERPLHRKFSRQNVKGEWFEFTEDIRIEIRLLEHLFEI